MSIKMKLLSAILFFILCSFFVTSMAKPVINKNHVEVRNHSSDDLILESEKTNFHETGNYSEVQSLCHTLTLKHPNQVACKTMGSTSEGRPILYLVVSKKGALTPKISSDKKIPVVLVIAGTHSGEIDGKDASFIYFRELLDSKETNNPLDNMTVLWIPVFNVDGHEHRGRFQRPNQDGPFEQGERTNARRINLNRDWILAQSQEMQSMLHLVKNWNPSVTVDLHVTDGLRFRHDVSITVAPEFGGDPNLSKVAQRLLDNILASVKDAGHSPLGFYPRLKDKEDPKAGFIKDVDSPRLSHTYAAIRNRVGILVEDYAWESYAARIQTCRDTLSAILKAISADSNEILQAESRADSDSGKLGGSTYALDYEANLSANESAKAHSIDLLGYEYKVNDPAPVVGGRIISYDLSKKEIWHAPFYNDVQPIKESEVHLPRSGYLVPTAWAGVVKPYLDLHGVEYRIIKRRIDLNDAEIFQVRPEDIAFDSASFQGRQRVSLKGEWLSKHISVHQGAIFVPISQQKAHLVAHLFEPNGPDSLSAWGLFNTAYEISDYIANHRLLEVIRWVYEDNGKIKEVYGDEFANQIPQMRQEYEKRLELDEKFKLDPDSHLDFWVSKLPPQDPLLNRYPIIKVEHLSF